MLHILRNGTNIKTIYFKANIRKKLVLEK